MKKCVPKACVEGVILALLAPPPLGCAANGGEPLAKRSRRHRDQELPPASADEEVVPIGMGSPSAEVQGADAYASEDLAAELGLGSEEEEEQGEGRCEAAAGDACPGVPLETSGVGFQPPLPEDA